MTYKEEKERLLKQIDDFRKKMAGELDKVMGEFDLSARTIAGVFEVSHTIVNRWCSDFFLPPAKHAEKIGEFIIAVREIEENWKQIVAGWRRDDYNRAVRNCLYKGIFRALLDSGGDPHEKVKILTKKTIEAWSRGGKE